MLTPGIGINAGRSALWKSRYCMRFVCVSTEGRDRKITRHDKRRKQFGGGAALVFVASYLCGGGFFGVYSEWLAKGLDEMHSTNNESSKITVASDE